MTQPREQMRGKSKEEEEEEDDKCVITAAAAADKKKGMKNNLECPDYIFQQVYQLYMFDALKIIHAFSFIINNFYFTFKV